MVKKMNYMTKDKPYNSLNNYYKKIYNSKVAKISLNANFTCPNKDGTKGFGGCIYCSKLGSGYFAGDKNDSLAKQFNDIKTIIEKNGLTPYTFPICRLILIRMLHLKD